MKTDNRYLQIQQAALRAGISLFMLFGVGQAFAQDDVTPADAEQTETPAPKKQQANAPKYVMKDVRGVVYDAGTRQPLSGVRILGQQTFFTGQFLPDFHRKRTHRLEHLEKSRRILPHIRKEPLDDYASHHSGPRRDLVTFTILIYQSHLAVIEKNHFPMMPPKRLPFLFQKRHVTFPAIFLFCRLGHSIPCKC